VSDESGTTEVYLLWHTHTLDGGGSDEKLLGVYSTEEKANERMLSASELPGFSASPSGFEVARYVVDRDESGQGFESS
jgi:hypothetical protein